MEHIEVNGTKLAYVERGSGDETVVLSHSYLVDHRQYESQIDALAKRYRVLAYDHRGHGSSAKPAAGYDMDQHIYADGVAFVEATDAAPCHWVGLSSGGFVGLRMAIRRPELLRSLVLMDTAADGEPPFNRIKYEAMFRILGAAGFGPLIKTTMKIMFGPTFLRDPARQDEVALWRERMTANDIPALIAFGQGIFGREPVLDRLGEINVPTLVLAGEHDKAIPLSRHQPMADLIPGARLQIIPRAGHLSTIENPTFINEALLSFFEGGALPTRDGEPLNVRTPRSASYDGSTYGRLIEPLVAGVHAYVVERLPEGERVLDACCGTGGLARRMAERGRDVVGVDLSPRNIDFARERAGGTGVRFELGDVADLPYEDDAFDVATIVMALHEMPQACRVPVLRSLGRVARRVMIVDFHAPMPLNVAGVRNRAIELAAGREHFGAFRDFCRRGGLAPLLDAAGLQVDSTRLLDQGTLCVQVAQRQA